VARDHARTATREWRRSFLASDLVTFLATLVAPSAVVVALPCALDDRGVPGSSSYPTLEGDITLVPDALARAGLSQVPAMVLNDAELAALAVRVDHPDGEHTLVVTLGFGVGAAVLR
jgi:predicted NBD/HSP70 family sugar kinase